MLNWLRADTLAWLKSQGLDHLLDRPTSGASLGASANQNNHDDFTSVVTRRDGNGDVAEVRTFRTRAKT
jgi:hypothetical protein